MFEQIFRQMFSTFRTHTIEVMSRLSSRLDRNEKIELFCMKQAQKFPGDPRGTIRFMFYFGIVYGWLLSGNRNSEIEQLFDVSEIKQTSLEQIVQQELEKTN